jgi:adenylate cyclase class IV
MQNIEIKARCADLELAKEIAFEIGAQFGGELHQIDTYFKVNHGRLKLREMNSRNPQLVLDPLSLPRSAWEQEEGDREGPAPAREAQLIYYDRPNEPGARLSNYQIYPVSAPDILKELMTQALGVWRVIKKQRRLFWFENVRIHLDHVEELGDFIEFEGIVETAQQTNAVRQKVERLQQVFDLSASHLISSSYSELAV